MGNPNAKTNKGGVKPAISKKTTKTPVETLKQKITKFYADFMVSKDISLLKEIAQTCNENYVDWCKGLQSLLEDPRFGRILPKSALTYEGLCVVKAHSIVSQSMKTEKFREETVSIFQGLRKSITAGMKENGNALKGLAEESVVTLSLNNGKAKFNDVDFGLILTSPILDTKQEFSVTGKPFSLLTLVQKAKETDFFILCQKAGQPAMLKYNLNEKGQLKANFERFGVLVSK